MKNSALREVNTILASVSLELKVTLEEGSTFYELSNNVCIFILFYFIFQAHYKRNAIMCASWTEYLSPEKKLERTFSDFFQQYLLSTNTVLGTEDKANKKY